MSNKCKIVVNMNQEKVKISVVSYFNSKPFVYGLDKSDYIKERATISLDIPSVCAQKLLNNQVDLGLVPVAIIPRLKEYYILTEYCIGAKGAVKSVMLYSEVPLDEIKRIYLDYQSESSVALVKVLSRNFWKIDPEWLNAPEHYIELIKGSDAGVVIGDRTFALKGKFKFAYDLSDEWMEYTGLPFVFACWVSNKKLPDDFINEFNKALQYGVNNKQHVIDAAILAHGEQFDVQSYLSRNISYHLDIAKKESLKLFLRLLQ